MASFHERTDVRPARDGEHPRDPARESDLDLYLTRLFLPLACGAIAVADFGAENIAWLRAAYGEVQLVALSKDALTAEILRAFGDRIGDDAVFALDRRAPGLSARTVATRRQKRLLAVAAALVAVTAWRAPWTFVDVLVWAMSMLFLLSVFLRAHLAFLGAAPRRAPNLDRTPDADLPLYTILVPLYREARVLPGLVRALLALDYPRERLDIKLVVEADDVATVQACEAHASFAPFEIVRVPQSLPRTKPKAVNYALRFARGDFTVIYDAEDRPEPDQLRKAVDAFRRLPHRVACLQARLAFYNARESWLAALFDQEYGLWFGMLLPGLDRLAVPIPLGGTSNHFRSAVLRAIGAWDPFNVTEDADLGIRLSQQGLRVAMLDSTTFEEAPIRLGNWIKQRARWLKGYMQTWLVHGRNTRSLVAQTGLRGYLAFQLFIGGTVVSAIVNPLLWIVCIVSGLLPGDHAVSLVSGAGAIGANAILTGLVVAASVRRGEGRFALYGLTVTLYWLLISVAGYRALWHLFTKPFHWEKTAHGVSRHA